jgi:hypothetical protein
MTRHSTARYAWSMLSAPTRTMATAPTTAVISMGARPRAAKATTPPTTPRAGRTLRGDLRLGRDVGHEDECAVAAQQVAVFRRHLDEEGVSRRELRVGEVTVYQMIVVTDGQNRGAESIPEVHLPQGVADQAGVRRDDGLDERGLSGLELIVFPVFARPQSDRRFAAEALDHIEVTPDPQNVPFLEHDVHVGQGHRQPVADHRQHVQLHVSQQRDLGQGVTNER